MIGVERFLRALLPVVPAGRGPTPGGTHPVLVGGGTAFFTGLDSWADLNLLETRTFPGAWL